MFTFKKMPKETGLRAIANPYPETVIKKKGARVGRISPPSAHNGGKWKVSFMVEEKASENCPWGWINFKRGFESEKDARIWVNQVNLDSYTIYELKDN